MRRAVPLINSLCVMMIGLAGCATHSQKTMTAMQTNAKVSGESLRTCIADVDNDPRFAPIKAHLPANGVYTLEQMANPNMATNDEISLILEFHPKLESCRQNFINQLSTTSPTFAIIWANAWTTNEFNLLQVIQKKMTWGDYTKQSKVNVADLKTKLTVENQRVTASLNQQNAQEQAQRAAALQAMGNALNQYAQTQALINAANRPVVTNCNTFGNQTNCVSR